MRKVIFILLLVPIFCNAQIITTIAGTGISGHTGDGGPATAANIPFFGGGVFDIHGNYFFAEITVGQCIRKISPDGIISTVAGNGTPGFGGDGGPATAASLHNPSGVAVDTFGNLYISDLQNGRIRKVDVNGIITTIAGNGSMGYGGDGGPATNAVLKGPQYVHVDKAGNVYISDASNYRVRKIDKFGIINTIAGTGLFVYNGDGGLADTSNINFPIGLCTDEIGNLYIAESAGGRIRKVDISGHISTVAGDGSSNFSGDGGPATAAGIVGGYITTDRFGNLYLAEPHMSSAVPGDRVRMINTSGIITTIAGNGIGGYNGDGGLAITSRLNNPCGVAVDSCGNLYIADDWNHRVRKVTFQTACENLDTKQKAMTKSISIYPNPTTDIITMEWEESISEINIINSIGQVVYHNTYNAKKLQINVASLPLGVYILNINGVTIRKFIKQ